MNYEKYLPIGTIVKLKGGIKRVMISGFYCMAEDGNRKIYDYLGYLYPEGYYDPLQSCLFNHEQIEKVYYVGYSDEDDNKFRSELKKYVDQVEVKN